MIRIIQWYNNLSAGKKIIVYVIGTIILGAIGSGVWVKILEPTFNCFLDFLIKTLSYFSSVFKNNLYIDAAKGLKDSGSPTFLSSFYIFSTLYILFAIFFLKIFKNYFKVTENIQRLFSEIIFSNITLFYFFLLFFYLSWIGIRTSYINEIVTSSLNSIEIVRPFIDEKNYIELKSDFYSMRSVDDYTKFYNNLLNIKQNKVAIKLFVKEPL